MEKNRTITVLAVALLSMAQIGSMQAQAKKGGGGAPNEHISQGGRARAIGRD